MPSDEQNMRKAIYESFELLNAAYQANLDPNLAADRRQAIIGDHLERVQMYLRKSVNK